MISYKNIQMFCVFYIVIWMISPPLAYGQIYRIIAIGAAVVWSLMQLLSRRENSVDIRMKNLRKIYLICVVIYSVTLLATKVIFEHMTIIGAFYNNITTYILLFVGYIAATYCYQKRYEELKKILVLSIILAVFFSITSLMRSEELYYMTRRAGGEDDEAYNELARQAAMKGVGGFGFFAFTSALSPIILWLSFLTKKIPKTSLLVAFFIVELAVLSGGYTLALLISFVGIVLTVYINMKSNVAKLLVILGMTLIVIMADDISLHLYAFLSRIAEGTMYENKVYDIFAFLIDGESGGTFAARKERYLYSLESMIKYPVLGSYLLDGENAVGAHSSILDPFAAYGWLVGFCWLFIIAIFPYKLAGRQAEKGLKIMLFSVLFLTALFNRTTMIMGVFFLLAPAMGYLQRRENDC